MNAAGIGAMIIALVTAIGLSGCRTIVTEARPLTSVRIAAVQTISTNSGVRYSATVLPNAQVDLAFKSGGYVESIRQVRGADGRMRALGEGDWITRGTVLAVVRKKDYDDQHAQARAQLDKAQAEYEQASLNFERTSRLYSSQSATKPEYDAAKAQQQSSLAGLNNTKAILSQAQTALDDASLRAPFDGWVVKRNVDVGALVGPSVPVFTIADTRTVRVIFGVPENMLGRIRLGDRQSITTDSVANTFAGTVTAISPEADPKSRVYSVEVRVPNPNNQFKAGMIASLELGGASPSSTAYAVPLSAVIRDPMRPEGFAVLTATTNGDEATVTARGVELGSEYGNMIHVLSGLTAGEHVVTTGATMVKNGDHVSVIQ
jgi:multidrug efflux system membrane fusion protein